ncbi:unnamed protein product [Linum tenue]|uniref:RING-type domain-containing protein n=1 Tax=Linum tenue TaxID=586396 RepID=A0AAV0RVU5_9ROSI|nr:unnamed protein product [Linum tenue]
MDDGPPANDCCSICHGRFKVPCQANCSHWFCGDCIMLVWQHGSAVQACKCPLCRRSITLLVPGQAALRDRNDTEVSEVLVKVQRYNRLFGGETSGLIQVITAPSNSCSSALQIILVNSAIGSRTAVDYGPLSTFFLSNDSCMSSCHLYMIQCK